MAAASAAPARGRNGSEERGEEEQALTRILVVEDDEFMAAALVSMLQTIAETNTAAGAELCLQVEHTSTGESAWDLLSSRRYDIALVDVKLPGITGLDLSWCYESSFSEGVTVHDTVMIACTSEIDPAALYEHGLKDVLKKPVTMASLRHMLHKWMPRRNASSFTLQSYPTPLGRGIKSGSGIFSARILLVEDCEVTAMATQCMFQEMGLWIDSVVDGEAGMNMLSGAATYDLILLDVNLPKMSGYALCSWYKEHCRSQDLMTATVVAVTSDPDKAACMEFGFDHVLPKPLTAHSCYKVLRRWLESRAHRMFTAPADHPDGDGDDGDDGSEGFGGGFGGGSGLYPGGSSGMGGMGAMGSLGCMGSNASMEGMGGRACGDGHGTSPHSGERSGSDGATTCTCGGGGGSSGSTSGGVGGGHAHAAGGGSGARSVSDAMCDAQPSNRAGDAGSVPEWPTHG